MRSSKILNLWNSYLEPLETINGIKFTPKEIELIACMLSGKSAKTISSFLSVSPKTIEGHLHNIMTKLTCNSRDGIIQFIEKSDKFGPLKEYYLSLLIQSTFKKALQEIEKITRPKASKCRIVYWPELNAKNYDAEQLAHYLQIAGIESFIEARKGYQFLSNNFDIQEYQKNNVLYFIPEAMVNQLSENSGPDKSTALTVVKFCSQNGAKSIFLVSGEKTKRALSQVIGNIIDVNFLSQENIYFLVFEILEKLFPTLSLEKIVIEFKQQYKKTHVSQESTNSSNSLKIEGIEKYKNNLSKLRNFLKSHKWLVCSAIALFCISCVGFSFLKKDQQEGTSIRSDLNIPTESVFMTRPELIKQIDSSFKDKSGIQTIALIGPGGAGKTTLARQYAHNQKASVIWEINAETKGSLIRSFENLANSLARTKESKKILREIRSEKNYEEREKQIIQFIKEHLRTKPDWLLIFDNVEKYTDIQPYLPQDFSTWGRGRILLTTRDRNIQNNTHVSHIIQVGELALNQKFNLFTKIMTQENKRSFTPLEIEDAKAFLEHIPSFPLDVCLAAYYLKATHIPYTVYLENLTKYNRDFAKIQEDLLKEAGEYTKTRYNIIIISLQNIINENKVFIKLLLFTSLVDSQNIPRDLLENCTSKILVDDFMHNLKKYSLATDEPMKSFYNNFPTLSMHRSTQALVLAYLINLMDLKKDKHSFEHVGTIFKNYMIETMDREDFPKMNLLIRHCKALLSHPHLFSDFIIASIKSDLGNIYRNIGKYEKAKQFLNDSIITLKKNSYDNHPTFARALTWLGSIYRELSDYKKAKQFLKQGIIIYKKSSYKNHPWLARALQLLGSVYEEQGNYKIAQQLLEESLVIYRKNSYENHPWLARALQLLGNIYRAQGNYKQAKALLEQSISIYEKNSCENLPWYTLALAGLGKVCRDLRDYEKAKKLLAKSISIHRKNFFKNGLLMAQILEILGSVYRELGDYEKAKQFFEESLAIYKKNSFEKHTWFAGTLSWLGDVYRELGEYKKAQKLLEESLVIYKQHSYEGHPWFAWSLENLGFIHKELGNYEKATHLIEDSILIYKKSAYENHPWFARALVRLGCIYRDQSNYKKAHALLKQGLQVYEKTYDKDHIDIARVFKNLALNYLREDHVANAEEYLRKALDIFQKNNHPDIYSIFEDFADFYLKKSALDKNKGDTKQSKNSKIQAINYLNQALDIVKTHFPKNSPHIERLEAKLKKVKEVSYECE